METKLQNPATSVMQIIQQTHPTQIAELDFVREKFIQNYNYCHREKVGDLVYHRQVVHFKQIIANSSDLKNCDPFSLYACFLTAAVRGYSFDPADDEVYLLPRGGKACLQRQAGAYVRRLMSTGQIQYADQPKFVYHGDTFEVRNGRVLNHVENFKSETVIAAYVRFQLDDKGNDRYFIYRKSDWESWRSKSPQKNGANWNGANNQPEPGFLRTKIVLHACKEKCWAIGVLPVAVEQYDDVEIDQEDDVRTISSTSTADASAAGNANNIPDDAFMNQPKDEKKNGTTTVVDETF
jgi:recombinational DNA repair protein RecT